MNWVSWNHMLYELAIEQQSGHLYENVRDNNFKAAQILGRKTTQPYGNA